ncbi:hypothetical protein QBC39DRAFT_329079 [Podospora conica]|nr:hypothetical protein QBC39DRAFT_329079 [Schizothecium conicum]
MALHSLFNGPEAQASKPKPGLTPAGLLVWVQYKLTFVDSSAIRECLAFLKNIYIIERKGAPIQVPYTTALEKAQLAPGVENAEDMHAARPYPHTFHNYEKLKIRIPGLGAIIPGSNPEVQWVIFPFLQTEYHVHEPGPLRLLYKWNDPSSCALIFHDKKNLNKDLDKKPVSRPVSRSGEFKAADLMCGGELCRCEAS